MSKLLLELEIAMLEAEKRTKELEAENERLRELLREGILHLEADGSGGCESVAGFLKSKLKENN